MAKTNENTTNNSVIPDNVLVNKIYLIRDQKVMLDSDLAELYGVETRVLNQAVTRNISRFPEDFMFQLTQSEWDTLRSQIANLENSSSLRSQNVILKNSSNRGRHRKFLPNVFSEHGVLMLSSVLKSERAIQVNIQIMRIFTKIRQMLKDNADLWKEIADIKIELAKQVRNQDSQIKNIDLIFGYIDRLQENAELPSYKDVTVVSGFDIGKDEQ